MPAPICVRAIADEAEREQCARMMQRSEPWITLGRGYEAGLSMLRDANRERHVAVADGELAGFIVLALHGALVGYLQTICVAPEARNQGVGRALMAFAEELVFARHPNLFLMVSDFNTQARRFYEKLGYETIGELRDYLIAGRSEILMRKTRGPIRGYPTRA
jgi:ribosomal protein S18 acetylase RimI-like enzyme